MGLAREVINCVFSIHNKETGILGLYTFNNSYGFVKDRKLDNLISEKPYNIVRTYAYEELVIRYGCPIRFETDMLVPDQKIAINEIAAWVQENEGRFESGKWFFAGRLLE